MMFLALLAPAAVYGAYVLYAAYANATATTTAPTTAEAAAAAESVGVSAETLRALAKGPATFGVELTPRDYTQGTEPIDTTDNKKQGEEITTKSGVNVYEHPKAAAGLERWYTKCRDVFGWGDSISFGDFLSKKPTWGTQWDVFTAADTGYKRTLFEACYNDKGEATTWFLAMAHYGNYSLFSQIMSAKGAGKNRKPYSRASAFWVYAFWHDSADALDVLQYMPYSWWHDSDNIELASESEYDSRKA